MRACSACGRLYPDAEFCQADGQRLSTISQSPPRPDGADPRVGRTLLGRYLIYRVVADGGMGRVYEALDQLAQRQVALKVLHAHVAEDAVSIERFKREYDVSRRLPHGHIVEVLDFKAADDGSQVLVMEFLGGETLRAALARLSRLGTARIVRLLSQLALALDPAHRIQLVHRDLKPDNIFLCQTPDGDVVKVLDFGSVKQLGAQKQLTMLGATIGSPFYMSPEQAQGLPSLDGRADVWAVTVLAYEALTAKLPFVGTNAPSTFLQILSAEPTPPSQLRDGLPGAVDGCFARGFHKDPAHRTSTVGALADDFGQALGLSGEHRAWAECSEAELERQLGRQAAEARAPVASPRAASASSAGSGESSAVFVWVLCVLLLGALVAGAALVTR